ncbi:tannase/feruloyl esterase family alpha/beta hydrolase [Shewanella goraebulensis]|uniref:tannase/feruloyl esterase family alpha/beta hydrolase n=1 Tax=Shewanella goraebulensis TaxID=3050637 RepID=UPI0025505EE0|nr:tannase/feruloyl esterase family alpha/beta hydrolase [Shewanella goraebulensis]
MKMKLSTVALSITLSFALSGCNSSDDDTTSLPILGEAQPATLADCTALIEKFTFEDTVITSAELIDAGEIDYNGRGQIFATPAHCVLTGEMEERLGKGLKGIEDQAYAISFEMRLPTDWNGRFLYQANGGLDGKVNKAMGIFLGTVAYDASALNKGFAVISSDAGHDGYGEQYFGLDHQARINYGYGAVEKLTPMAKSLISDAYGKQPDRSYFAGCSNGGRHTMVAATRFPEMYDGFLVGDPGNDLPQAAVTQLYGVQQFETLIPADAPLTTAAEITAAIEGTVLAVEYDLLASSITKQCDALDGLEDGIISDLVGCQLAFDINRDVPQCDGQRDGTCLTAEQKRVLGNIMAGPQLSSGEDLYTHFPYDNGIGASGWASWEMSAAFSRDAGTVATVFSTPPVEFDNYDTSSDAGLIEAYQYAVGLDMDEANTLINATTSEFSESSMSFMALGGETNYDVMRERGAKMILLHGTADPVFSVQNTIDWYQSVDEANAGNADEFAKLYLIPGMNHCGNGPATDQVNTILDDIVTWVETGMAPESITANAREENTELPVDWAKDRSRPLCPFPQVATYDGSGDIESSDSFSCIKPQ